MFVLPGFGLARLGAAGPERAQRSRTQAEATRNERHRESKRRTAAGDTGGEARKTKMAKLETTSAGKATVQRKVTEDNSSGNSGTGGSSDDSSNGDASSSAGRAGPTLP
jgi:hypothetical protein